MVLIQKDTELIQKDTGFQVLQAESVLSEDPMKGIPHVADDSSFSSARQVNSIIIAAVVRRVLLVRVSVKTKEVGVIL